MIATAAGMNEPLYLPDGAPLLSGSRAARRALAEERAKKRAATEERIKQRDAARARAREERTALPGMKRPPYREAKPDDLRRRPWSAERRAAASERVRKQMQDPVTREKHLRGLKRMWAEGRGKRARLTIPPEVIPAWVVGDDMKREFVDALIEGGEAAAAAHCRRLLRMMKGSEL